MFTATVTMSKELCSWCWSPALYEIHDLHSERAELVCPSHRREWFPDARDRVSLVKVGVPVAGVRVPEVILDGRRGGGTWSTRPDVLLADRYLRGGNQCTLASELSARLQGWSNLA